MKESQYPVSALINGHKHLAHHSVTNKHLPSAGTCWQGRQTQLTQPSSSRPPAEGLLLLCFLTQNLTGIWSPPVLTLLQSLSKVLYAFLWYSSSEQGWPSKLDGGSSGNRTLTSSSGPNSVLPSTFPHGLGESSPYSQQTLTVLKVLTRHNSKPFLQHLM